MLSYFGGGVTSGGGISASNGGGFMLGCLIKCIGLATGDGINNDPGGVALVDEFNEFVDEEFVRLVGPEAGSRELKEGRERWPEG